MKIVFIDPKCPKPYDSEVLATRGFGGAEATVVRIARALAHNHDVTVLQHNRHTIRVERPTLRFSGMVERDDAVLKAEHVVLIQKAQDLPAVLSRTSNRTRVWLWLHNFLHDEVPFFWQDHLRFRLGVICVSRSHAVHTLRYMRRKPLYWATCGLAACGGVLFHPKPIDENLQTDSGVKRDPHKLVFFNLPHKGIDQVLDRFFEAYANDTCLQLYVADPGYIKNFETTRLQHPGIVCLGSLPQAEILRHVREALCVFYPQYKRPETFGLVYAEANAVGTPVLTHDFGAAREVLSSLNPPFDARDPKSALGSPSELDERWGTGCGSRRSIRFASHCRWLGELLCRPLPLYQRTFLG